MAHNDTPTVLYQRLDQWTDGDKLAKTLHHRTRPLIAIVPYHDQDPTDLTLLARRFNHVCDIVRLQWDAQRAFNQAAGNQYITPAPSAHGALTGARATGGPWRATTYPV